MKDNLLIQLDLQFFAKMGPGGEKTEEPTSKKLEDSRKEGQVSKSTELNNAVMLIGLFLLLKMICSYLGNGFVQIFNYVYTRIPYMLGIYSGEYSSKDISSFLIFIMLRIILFVAPFFLASFFINFIMNVVQVKWKVTSKPLKPKLSKLNPVNGFKRIFSKDKLVELLKSLIKLGIFFYVAYSMLSKNIGVIMLLYDMPLMTALSSVSKLIIDVGLRISFVYLILGFADLKYQKWKFHEDMKMTKQEVKDEVKNQEGDPQVKGQQKRRMREASQRRMMQNVPQADVVITNPTHFAVALKYDVLVADAPIVVAKGQDYLAQKIKDAAKENDVEIVEDKALARLLYHNVPLDAKIPQELFQAVAEVLAFVYNLKKNRK